MKINDSLQRARDFEANNMVDKDLKPLFHVTAPVGWLNDPNGFSYFQGKYHLFFQYHPYSIKWGPMHWGHLTTSDFTRWSMLPCALAPDTEADKDGCFSGTAIDFNGRHVLMYTGVSEKIQAQCVAVGDGLNYEKLPQNPVINLNSKEFRDPKIYKEGNRFKAVVTYLGEDGSGELREFSSENLTDWEYDGVLERSGNKLGKMWECPDIFMLGDKKAIFFSATSMDAAENGSHPGNVGMYVLHDKNRQRISEAKIIDFGFDFYAPQTLEAADGRIIMIAWAFNWDSYLTPNDFTYSGLMTFPRELTLKENQLYQAPVKELDNYATKSGRPDRGRVFDLRVEAETEDWFSIKLAADEKYFTSVTYDCLRNTLSVDRTFSGGRKDASNKRTVSARNRGGKIDLRILMDKYMLEVFVNGGEQALTCLIYTPLTCDGIIFEGGKFTYDVEKFDLKL